MMARYVIETKDSETDARINGLKESGKLTIEEAMPNRTVEIQKEIETIKSALKTLKESGYSKRVMMAFLQQETGFSKRDINAMLDGLEDFFKAIGAI